MMDPIGFGLERFDGLGRYRTVEKHNAQCAIDGKGELGGAGAFSGVEQLVTLMTKQGELQRCAVKQLYHFAMGREPGADDKPIIDRLAAAFAKSGHDFRELVLDLVTDPSFRLRVDE